MRNRDIERQLNDAGGRAGDQVRRAASGATDQAQNLMDRGRSLRDRFGKRRSKYGRQLSNAAEDFADEANYHYRRARRQAKRHPVATVAIAAGTVGAFLLLYRAFSSNQGDED